MAIRRYYEGRDAVDTPLAVGDKIVHIPISSSYTGVTVGRIIYFTEAGNVRIDTGDYCHTLIGGRTVKLFNQKDET